MTPSVIHYEAIKGNPEARLTSGQTITILIRVRNDSGYGARYALACPELPEAWWSCEPVGIAENGDDFLELVITLPAGIPASEYATTVRALWDGRPDPKQVFPLRIIIVPAAAAVNDAPSKPAAPENPVRIPDADIPPIRPATPPPAVVVPPASEPVTPEARIPVASPPLVSPPLQPTEPPDVTVIAKPVPPPPAAPVGFCVAVYERGNLLQVYIVKPTGMTIGRDPGADVCLSESIVSRNHATLRPEGKRLLLRDSSSGGTFRNGNRVPPATDVAIEPGDILEVRPYALTVVPLGTTPPQSLTTLASPIPPELAAVTVSVPPAYIPPPISEGEAERPHPAAEDEVFGSERHRRAPLKFEEEVIYDPSDNEVISVLPGKAIVLCFRFTNPPENASELIFYIERHSRLKADDELNRWVGPSPRDRVDISPGQVGEVYARIQVPDTAAPDVVTLRFILGVQGTMTRDHRVRIHVREVPAVALSLANPSTNKDRIATGPFFLGRAATFALAVTQQGNSSTAFRLLLYQPDNPSTPLLSTVQEGGWDVQAHSELGQLRMPAIGVRAEPVTLHVGIQRRGIWWFGSKEECAVLVRAVPVTDDRNAGMGKNEQKITFVRSRLLPFPYPFLWLLLLLLIPIFGGNPTSVEVLGAIAQSGSDPTTYFIVNKPDDNKLKATLDWKAPFWLAVKPVDNLSRDSGMVYEGKTLVSNYPDNKPKFRPQDIEVQNSSGQGDTARARVFFLNCREDTTLAIGGGTLKTEQESEGKGTYALTVPKNGLARVTLSNQHPSDEILIAQVKQTITKSGYSLDGELDKYSIRHGAPKTYKIRNTGGSSGRGDIVLVTSDVKHRLITIKVQSGP